MDTKTVETPDVTAEPIPVSATPVPGSSIPPEELEQLTADIVAALKTVYDPEIPADIYELGLIYKIDVDDARNVAIEMTLTSPGCPVAGEMPAWVENAVGVRGGRRPGHRQAHLRSALGQGPHVRRGQARPRHVLTAEGVRPLARPVQLVFHAGGEGSEPFK